MTTALPRVLNDAAAIVDLVELKDVATIELRAAHKVGLFLPQPTEEPRQENQLLQRVDDEAIDIRLVSTVETDEVRISVDLLVRYTKREPFAATDEAMNEFVHSVGFMAGYPYLREAVASMSAKLGVGRITLKMIRAGSVEFRPDDRLVAAALENDRKVTHK